MDIKLEVSITESKTTIQLKDNQGTIEILNETIISSEKPVVYLLLKGHTVMGIGHTAKDGLDEADFDKIITILPTWDVEIEYLEQLLVEEAQASGIELNKERQAVNVPANAAKTVNNYLATITRILETFGYRLAPKAEAQPPKKKPAKAQHRWNKEVSQIEFYVNSRESKATVIWQKRNEMLVKAGAKIKPEAELNKDGSVGFSAKMGQKIRSDHQDKIKNFTTTEDIVLKSVNEVGLFLYFGGTNSWLELLDATGKSIDEYTVVK